MNYGSCVNEEHGTSFTGGDLLSHLRLEEEENSEEADEMERLKERQKQIEEEERDTEEVVLA